MIHRYIHVVIPRYLPRYLLILRGIDRRIILLDSGSCSLVPCLETDCLLRLKSFDLGYRIQRIRDLGLDFGRLDETCDAIMELHFS